MLTKLAAFAPCTTNQFYQNAALPAYLRSFVRLHCPLSLPYNRVFDTEGAQKFDKWVNRGKALGSKCFRGVNNNDIVTGVPPELFKIEGVAYKHVGKEIYINTRFACNSRSSPLMEHPHVKPCNVIVVGEKALSAGRRDSIPLDSIFKAAVYLVPV